MQHFVHDFQIDKKFILVLSTITNGHIKEAADIFTCMLQIYLLSFNGHFHFFSGNLPKITSGCAAKKGIDGWNSGNDIIIALYQSYIN